jgi:probable F420-dependent oxidoreductase
MKLAVVVSHVGHLVGDEQMRLIEMAAMADAAGIDQAVLTDHVVLGTNLDGHETLGAPFPYPSDEPYPEPLVTLAAMAAVTQRVRLATGLLIAPLRPAVLLAKTAATVDAISGGRLDLGVGTGWQPEEFAALGVPMEGKASRLDDSIRACQELWSSAPASFASDTVSFTDLSCCPRPSAGRQIPIWFGGTANRATARRIAELGVGWLPMGMPPLDELRRGVDLARQAFADAGRDPDTLGVRVTLPPVVDSRGDADLALTVQRVDELGAVGVTIVALPLGRFARDMTSVPHVLRQMRDLVGE